MPATTYQITEADGTDWGVWTASSPAEALDFLVASAASDPDLFPGFEVSSSFVVAEF